MKLLKTDLKNKVLQDMERILDENRDELLQANKKDLDANVNIRFTSKEK